MRDQTDEQQKPCLARRLGEYTLDTVKSKAYWVDTLTASSIAQPIMAYNEMRLNGMGAGECARRRVLAFGVALGINRPLCKARDYWGKHVWHVDPNKYGARELASDLSFVAISCPIIYLGILTAMGLCEGNLEALQTLKTTAKGTGLILGATPLFGGALTLTRRIFGTTPMSEEFKEDVSQE